MWLLFEVPCPMEQLSEVDHHPLHQRGGLVVTTEALVTDSCGAWTIFVSGSSVCTWVPHIKPKLVSHLIGKTKVNKKPSTLHSMGELSSLSCISV